MLDFLANLFNTSGFPPRWHCGLWTSGHGWLHILSDLSIWSAYYTIPLILTYFVYRRRDIPFRGIFLLFGVFILACGTTHLMDAIIFWWPAYRLSGVIKFVTAIASWATVIALVPIIPKALALRSPSEMENEVKRRTAELADSNESLRQSEERVREANRRKVEFLAMLAHELRNPLAPIRSGLDLLSLQGRNGTVVLMQEQLQHLVRLVDDLLDVSRIIQGRIQICKDAVRLDDIVERSLDASRPLIAAQNHELTVSLPSSPIWLDADAVRTTQVLTNLLNNAAKYTEKGGHIWLTVQEEADRAVIRVRDNGIGIDKALMPHLFDLFTQGDRALDRSQGGLGIGLTIVKTLVEMQGGKVEARSEGIGKGSEFMVHLPVAARPAEQGARDAPRQAGTPRRVLIIEDNVVAAKMLAALLARIGNHEVQTAHDGEAGLKLAKAFRPEVVLVDIGLPDIDGYEVARRLREEPDGQRLLIAAVTGYGQEEDRRRSQEAGFDEHLLKPIALDVVQSLLRHAKFDPK